MHSAKQDTNPPCGCLAEALTKILAREWAAHIIWSLSRNGATRFGALKRSLPGQVSARVLSARLKELEAVGLLERRAYGDSILRVEYRLTETGLMIDGDLHRLEGRLGDAGT